MKTQYRVILLMLGILTVAAVGLTYLSQSEKQHAADLYHDIVDQQQRLFDAVYRLDGTPQASLATDYTYWDDLVNFTKNPQLPANQTFAHENLDTALATYQVNAVWIYQLNGQPVYQTNDLDLANFKLPLTLAQIQAAFAKQPQAHFFVRTDQGIVELRGATITSSADPKHLLPPQGYFFTGRVYGLAYRERLGADLKSQVDLASQAPNNLPAPSTGQVVLSKALLGQNAKAIGYLQTTSDAPSIRDIYQLTSKRLQNFVVIVVPVLLVLFWFLTRYVTEPLSQISRTLKSHDPDSLTELESKHNEFGQIAALLGDYFRQNRIQLGAAHARLRASINSINIGFIMTDVNKQITMVNDAARKILFEDVKRAHELNLAELDQLMPKLQLERTVTGSMETIASHSLGEVQLQEKFLRVFVAPVTEVAGKAPVLGAIILIEDITLERSLKRARDEFFSIASHELRTPLTVIMGNASMIAENIVPTVKNSELAAMTSDIFDSSKRLIQMVNDFLDTSRLEQNRIKFELTSIDLTKVLPALVKEYQHVAAERQVKLEYELVKGTTNSVIVRADAPKLQQVLINLLSNAVTFTSQGSITFRLDPHPDYVRIYLSDTGDGIPLERHHLLFKKFQQAEENILSRNASRSLSPGSARDTTHGTGLGLYISKLLVEGMGGLIRLESSEVGKGTTFSVTLPTESSSRLKQGGQDGKKDTLN